MKNSEYWKQRFTQLEAAQNAIGENAKAEIERIYRETLHTIEGQITAWYERLAKNNDISMAEAKKRLRGKELKEFHWDVGDYIKYAEENAMNKAWIKELENASAKFHISRLEGLNIALEHSLQKLFHMEESIMTDAISEVYKEGFYRTMYELQKGFSVGFDVAKIDDNYVHKVLSKPWAADSYNFSERIWKNKTQLINEAHKIISQNVLTGAAPRKAIDAIAAKMKTSKYNAGRLVMTEGAYFSSLATGDCYKELDVEKYEILATLDNRTSDICQSMDGKVFDMKDYQAGVTAPPFHVFCRTTTVPYFDDDYGIKGQRAARNGDGKTYYVDGDMRYSEWKATFVEKSVDRSYEKGYNKSEYKTSDNERNVTSRNLPNGLRTAPSRILSDEEIKQLKKEISEINADVDVFKFNVGRRTGYDDELDEIRVRGDVLPDTNSNHPRDRMSSKAALAHEYYGHRANRGTKLSKGAWNDEFRASYMAAKNCPNLSDEDRYYLVLDALERAKEKGVSIKYNDFIRRVLYGY